MDRDKYEQLASLLKVQIQQVVFDRTVGLRNQVPRESFLLIDEADFVLIDGLQTVVNEKVVCLTATAFTDQYVYEKDFLQKQGFKVYNSFMSGYIDPATEAIQASLDDFW